MSPQFQNRQTNQFAGQSADHSIEPTGLSQSFVGLFLFGVIALFWTDSAFAVSVAGRFTVGGYYARETFSEADPFIGDRNDVQTVSARSYLKVSQIADPDDSFVADLRDKHDFFDKVDKQNLTLTDSNELQVRQLSYGSDRRGVGYRVGRFPIYDAGAVNVDGASVNYRTDNWNAFAFGGLNPLEYGKSYLQFRPKAQTYGAGFTFVPTELGARRGVTTSTAIVQESFSGEVDRRYIYQQFDIPFSSQQRLVSNLYVDTVPKMQLQNGIVFLDSLWLRNWKTQLSYLTLDTVQYVRRQDVREQLLPSAYNELRFSTRYLSELGNDWNLDLLNGVRAYDGKTRTLAELRTRLAQVGERRNWDFTLGFKTGKNFESQDLSAMFGVGFYSRLWELTAEQSYGIEKFSTTTYHPLITNLSVGRFFSRAFLSSFSFERIADERVEILALFFRLTYRYGSKTLAPIRDGSPPRGSL